MVLAAIGALLYWALGARPYLHIEGAKLSSPYLEIRTDRMGRLSVAPHEEGASVKQGELLFSLTTDEDKEMQKQLQAAVDSLQEMLSYCADSVETATQEYFAARSEIEMGLALSDHSEQPLCVLQERQSNLNECKQQLIVAQKNLERNSKDIQQKTVLAPFSGVIVKRQKREGDVVQFGDAIYSFCDPSRVWVDAIIPEKDIAKVTIGQRATIQLLIDNSRTWEGTVSWISPIAQPSGEGVLIKIQLEKTEHALLRPNLTANVKIRVH